MTLAAKLLGFPLATGYALTLLIVDVGLLLTLHHLLPKRHYLLLLAYWLSPIVILASYGLGLNDLIPVLLLTLALFFIRKASLRWTGIFCAMAISSKLSMIIALPFFLIYLYHNKALWQYALEFAKGFAIAALVFGAPFLASSDALLMLFSNPEMGKIYRLALSLGDHISIYIVPLIYLILLYQIWQVRRLNFHLFQATIGIAFLLIVLMTPASPGWFVWCIPFLVLYQSPVTQ
jgi:Gpi18-like mannosyltransferase